MAKTFSFGVILCSFLAFQMVICGDRDTTKSSHSKHKASDTGSQTCSQVRDKFVELGIGLGSLVPDSKVHDGDMDICYHGATHPHRRSCCSREMEHKYHQAMEGDFSDAILSSSSYLKHLLQQNIVLYQDKFVKMISTAQNNTDTLFARVYKIPVRERWGALDDFFLVLQAYVEKRDVTINLQDTTAQFFDELFPLVFKHVLNNLGDTEMSEDYRLCLMVNRKELQQQPFGDTPNKFTHSVAKSLGSARDFLQALSTAVDILDATDHYHLEHRCSKVLTKLEYCSHCQGYTEARPCRGYCQNVMRGCLAEVTDLDPSWNQFIDTLDTMTSNMRGTYNIENVMRTLHSHISDAFMHALEVGPKFYHKIVDKCGHPQGKPKDASSPLQTKPDTSNFQASWNHQGPDLHTKMTVFMKNLKSSKGFYKNLPDTLCTEPKFSTGTEEPCWNGDNVGTYNKTVVANTVEAQRSSNPEFRVEQQTSDGITALRDKLIKMTTTLNDRITAEMTYQSDDWQAHETREGQGQRYSYYGYDDYGSGRGYYRGDDEDSAWSGSGSGDYSNEEGGTGLRTGGNSKGEQNDWDFTDKHPYITQKPKPGSNPHQGDSLGGAASIRPSSYTTHTFLASCVLCLILWLNG